jgi:hypothetical protein
MILNKFIPSFLSGKNRSSGLWLLVFVVFACNKSSTINENKSYITVIHVAYGLGPVKLTVQLDTLSTTAVEFGQFSGYINGQNDSVAQYDTVTAGVGNLELISGSSVLAQGNSAFQQGARYSMFVYDTLIPGTSNPSPARLFILQDNLTVRTDTFTYVRFMNFTPNSSYSILLTDSANRTIDTAGNTVPVVDTVRTPYMVYAGYNLNPGFYTFTRVRLGHYKVQATANYLDSPVKYIQLDSLRFDSLKIYNIYLQGFVGDTGVNKFQVKSMQLN